MDNKLMVVQQLPVIKERLITIKEEFEKAACDALALVCNERTYKTVKDKRAEITAIYNELESERKSIKKAILDPYEKLEVIYNQCVKDIYTDTKAKLDKKIADVENGLKAEKEADVKAFFDEYSKACLVDFVSFEKCGIKVTMSASAKKLKEQAKEFIDKIKSDIALIRTQPEELRAEMTMEYKETFDVNRAISAVIERKEKILKEQENTEKEAELNLKLYSENAPKDNDPEPLYAPKEEKGEAEDGETEKKYRMTFTVEGTMAQLKAIKQYLTENKIEFIGGSKNE